MIEPREFLYEHGHIRDGVHYIISVDTLHHLMKVFAVANQAEKCDDCVNGPYAPKIKNITGDW